MNNIPSPLPTTSDEWLERDIKRVGADKAPRVTPDDVKANIVSEFYFTAEEGVHASIALTGTTPGWPCEDVGALIPKPLRLLTFCVLVLRNGFTVTGESACASPENFNAEIGRNVAKENAVSKIWPLMGYELRSRLAEAKQ